MSAHQRVTVSALDAGTGRINRALSSLSLFSLRSLHPNLYPNLLAVSHLRNARERDKSFPRLFPCLRRFTPTRGCHVVMVSFRLPGEPERHTQCDVVRLRRGHPCPGLVLYFSGILSLSPSPPPERERTRRTFPPPLFGVLDTKLYYIVCPKPKNSNPTNNN